MNSMSIFCKSCLISISKKVYKKDSMKKVVYSENETENTVAQQSTVGKFLSSIRQKMYGKRKF